MTLIEALQMRPPETEVVANNHTGNTYEHMTAAEAIERETQALKQFSGAVRNNYFIADDYITHDWPLDWVYRFM